MVRELCAWNRALDRRRVWEFTVPMKESDQIQRFSAFGRSTEYVPSAPVQPGPFWMKKVSKVESGVPAPGAGGRVHCADKSAIAHRTTATARGIELGIYDRSVSAGRRP